MSLIKSAILQSYKNSLNSNAKNEAEITSSGPGDGKVTQPMRDGWEAYRTYLDETGMYGNKKLNTSFGKTYFENWAKKNPQYELSLEKLPLIGEELVKLKKDYIQAAAKDKTIEYYEGDKKVSPTQYNKTAEANAKTKNQWWPGTGFTDMGYMNQSVKASEGDKTKETNFGQVTPETGILTPDMVKKAQEALKNKK